MTEDKKRIIADAFNSLITEKMHLHREYNIVKCPFLNRYGGFDFFLYDPQKRKIVAIEYTREGKVRTIKLNQ